MSRLVPRRYPHRNKKYGSVRLLHDERVRLSAWTIPDHWELDFLVTYPIRVTLNDDFNNDFYNPASYSLLAVLRGKWAFDMDVEQNRVTYASFTYLLTADEFKEVVSLLRIVGNGLERWIIPALEHHQADDIVKKKHPDVYKLVCEYLETFRDLPVAEAWQQRRRAAQLFWKKAIKKNPRVAAKAPAPWVLPPEARAQMPADRTQHNPTASNPGKPAAQKPSKARGKSGKRVRSRLR